MRSCSAWNAGASKKVAAVVLVLGFAAGLTFAPSSARADDEATKEAREHSRKAKQFFDLGQWDDAIAEYREAYRSRSDPAFLFNMAQSYRRKGDPRLALDLYKNYLIENPNAPGRGDIEKRIQTLEEEVKKTPSGPAPLVTPPEPPPATVPTQPAAVLAPPAPLADQGSVPSLPAPSTGFRHGLFGVGFVLGFHGWGHIQPGNGAADVTEKFWPGIHLSGYGVLGSHVLLGGYFSYAAGSVEVNWVTQHQSETGVGFSLKLGGNVGSETWIGFAGDLGAVFRTNPGNDTLKGVSLFPRFELRHVLLTQGGFKLGVYAALGPRLIPYTDGRIGEWNANFWMISTQGIVGVALGR